MPTEDLCNYIENKANQSEPVPYICPNTFGGIGGKIKKRGQPMSIEDQENRQAKGDGIASKLSDERARLSKHNFNGQHLPRRFNENSGMAIPSEAID
jgi:hypothetical protein